MKKLSRKQMVAVSLAVFGIASAGISAAYAAEAGREKHMSQLVSAIAQKFGLSETDVQKVFEEQRIKMETQRLEQMAQMQAKRIEQFTEKIDKAVTDGKLTQTQANLVKAKFSELQAAREAQKNTKTDFKNMTQDERKADMAAQKAKMETERTALQQWAEQNNIPAQYMPGLGMGMGKGRGGRGMND